MKIPVNVSKKDETTEVPQYTCSSLTVFQDRGTKRWHVARIKFDPVLKIVNPEIEIIATEDAYDHAHFRFKTVAGQELFKNKGDN